MTFRGRASLGRRLRVLRAEQKLSLRQVSKLAGIAKETLSDVERGKRHPHDLTLAKLADVYDVSLEELFDHPRRAERAKHKIGHTPGPWEMAPCYGTEDFEVYSEYGWFLARVNESVDGEFNGEANARLIAAAPDLYEAAQRVWDYRPARFVEPYSSFGQALLTLTDAIAKAEGKDKQYG